VALAAAVPGREPNLQDSADAGKHGRETVASLGHRHKWNTPDEGRRIERGDASLLAREMHEGRRAGRRGGEAKATVVAWRARREQLRSGKAVRARVMRRGFDAQRKTGGGGRPVLMASQQVERAVELLNPEVRAELNRRVRECEQKCFASGWLGSFPQASACARQQTTREQVKSHGCVNRGSSTRKQEYPEVHGGVSIANQSGPIGFFHESTTSSSSYSSPIVQARPTPQESS
jgi:hypothetical protein